jgi:hypothetical protein
VTSGAFVLTSAFFGTGAAIFGFMVVLANLLAPTPELMPPVEIALLADAGLTFNDAELPVVDFANPLGRGRFAFA